MAVEPLYHDSLDALLATVRIGTADDAQTLAAVYQAVTDVRMGFFRNLGKARALLIAGYASSDNPETDEEVLKASAKSAEAVWLMLLLISRLPVNFIDNRASTGDAWNDEPLTRDAASLKNLQDELRAQLDDLLGDLADDDSNVNTSVKVALNGNADGSYLLSENRTGYPQ